MELEVSTEGEIFSSPGGQRKGRAIWGDETECSKLTEHHKRKQNGRPRLGAGELGTPLQAFR